MLAIHVWASRKIRFFSDSRVSIVLKLSRIVYTLRPCARRRLTLVQKSLFFEVPNIALEILIDIPDPN